MNTHRTDPATERQLAAIAEVAGLGIPVWLRGGWAVDFFLGHVTRPHRDVDWFAWAADAGRITGELTARGWELLPEPPHDRQLDFVSDGVDLSFALITTDAERHVVVAGGPWAGERWPDGMLAGPVGRIGAVACAVIHPYAQKEIKRMMPVWVPGLPRRPKDDEDVRRLEAALNRPGTAAESSP
ncbi:aminoglycoside adenylyltransferase [Actinoplanes sp. NPDC023714]|uniref:nucleotidyltransferase domain-containing protein n=1 Tax=Actinoplanes sp. NPDC023714 TaxID=3154322 RepID=UPI0033EF3077